MSCEINLHSDRQTDHTSKPHTLWHTLGKIKRDDRTILHTHTAHYCICFVYRLQSELPLRTRLLDVCHDERGRVAYVLVDYDVPHFMTYIMVTYNAPYFTTFIVIVVYSEYYYWDYKWTEHLYTQLWTMHEVRDYWWCYSVLWYGH